MRARRERERREGREDEDERERVGVLHPHAKDVSGEHHLAGIDGDGEPTQLLADREEEDKGGFADTPLDFPDSVTDWS